MDWQSLTFSGERHAIDLRFAGPNSEAAVERMCCGLEDAEFRILRVILADIAVAGTPSADGSTSLTIEALTIPKD